MSGTARTRMLNAYIERASAPTFFASFFQSPRQNFHNTEKVEVDVMRDDEDVATVITDLSTGGNLNENTLYTNKGFTPPIFEEEGSIKAFNMLSRRPGQTPFEDADMLADAASEAMTLFERMERKIRRAIELMASQVFQTGILTLTDKSGNVLYTLDFQMKSEHKPAIAVPWAADGNTGDPLGDIESLADTVHRNGKRRADTLVFGSTALQRFLANGDVKEILNSRRRNSGEIEKPMRERAGAKFWGTFAIGNQIFDIWHYDGFYRPPGGQQQVPYLASNAMVMIASEGRRDLTYGGIPRFVDQPVLTGLPRQIVSSEKGLGMDVYSYVTPNGRTLMVSCGARPLTIPTAIDTFGTFSSVTG